MKFNAKSRNINPPNFNLELFKNHVENNFKNFDVLFQAWTESGYDKWLRPSIDRIDNSVGYTFQNIRLVTWRENYEARLLTLKEQSRWKISEFKKEDIIKIKKMAAEGYFSREIAEVYKVSRTTIDNIRKGVYWSDVI